MRHVMTSTYQRTTMESIPNFVTPAAVLATFQIHPSSIQERACLVHLSLKSIRSELVTDLDPEHTRAGDVLRQHELIRRGIGALDDIRQVLGKEFRRPGI